MPVNYNKPPKAAMSTLIKRALINRYDFKEVRIDRAGDIFCVIDMKYGDSQTQKWGNVRDYTWRRSEGAGNIQICSGTTSIFTFSYDN